MTVCIAATCANGNALVLASDRMFTNSALSLEFEPETSKIESLVENQCYALASGDSATATELIANARKNLNASTPVAFSSIVKELERQYVAMRDKRIEVAIINQFLGSDWKTFKDRGVPLSQYLQTQPQVYQAIVQQMTQFNLGVQILIAGFEDGCAHVVVLDNPGISFSLDKLGYATIGSGGPHANIFLSLRKQSLTKPLKETIYSVFCAKKSSEVAPGVGDATDLAVLTPGKCSILSDSVKTKLSEIRETDKERNPDLSGVEV